MSKDNGRDRLDSEYGGLLPEEHQLKADIPAKSQRLALI